MNYQSRAAAGGEHSPPTSSGKSIKLFLADGTPQGLIVAEIMNWTGQALSAPRARLADLLGRTEASRTGVYILMGPDPDRPAGAMAYIGEADNIAKRLRRHLAMKGRTSSTALLSSLPRMTI